MTPATMNLVTILLQDSAKIMALQEEEEVPLYTLDEVGTTLEKIHPLPFQWKLPLCDGQVQATLYPAGHILGAASLGLESAEGHLLISGDISTADQITIPGARIPELQPDCIVVEATYGGQVHRPRREEEKRLLEQVEEVMQRRGTVLFPAFAVGRAQEIILLLADAIETERLPRAAVFVDGMVRSVCKTYRSHPGLLSRKLHQRIERFQDPFFYRNGFVLPVWDPQTRKQVAQTQPAIIVASSGMLTGGPSQFYAKEVSGGQRNLLAITGYQDEESPGRQVQNLARKGQGTLRFGEEEVAFHCAVGTYGLSAHADSEEITGWLQATQGDRPFPSDILLAHGEGGAREELRTRLQAAGLGPVHLLGRRDSFEVEPKRAVRTTSSGTVPPSPAPLQKSDLAGLAQRLVDRDRPNMLYTVQDILLGWGAPLAAHDAAEKQRVAALLRANPSSFRVDKKRPFLFRVRLDQEVRWKDTTGPMELNKALGRTTRLFPPETGIYKRGAEVDRQRIVLWSDFPLAEEDFEEEKILLQEETGWGVEFRVRTRHTQLQRKAKECIPSDWRATGPASIHSDEKTVVVYIQPTEPSLSEQSEAIQEDLQAFEQETGYQIRLASAPPDSPPIGHAVVGSSTPTLRPGNRLEINAAYSRIKLAFRRQPHALLKVSCKDDAYLEVAFISPPIGERYRPLLDELSEETGWPIQIKPTPDQVRIEQVVRERMVCTKVRFFRETLRIEGVVETWPEEAERIQNEFAERTGCSLEFRMKN